MGMRYWVSFIFSSAPDFSQVGEGDMFTLNRFNGLLWKTVKTVNQISPTSITALKCGANELFKLTHYQDSGNYADDVWS
jgi:hypothetical protein